MQVIYKGKAIEVPDGHARLLVKAGRAKWPKGEAAMKAEAPGKSEPDGKAVTTKRAYKRRDMKAED